MVLTSAHAAQTVSGWVTKRETNTIITVIMHHMNLPIDIVEHSKFGIKAARL